MLYLFIMYLISFQQMSNWLFGHYRTTTTKTYLVISIGRNPTFSCQQLVMKHCHGRLKFGWKFHLVSDSHCINIYINLRTPTNWQGMTTNVGLTFRATVHLEAGPICCVRGLKSSLVIGQKAQIGPKPFTPKGGGDLVVWIFW
jgi:hypothetical protein